MKLKAFREARLFSLKVMKARWNRGQVMLNRIRNFYLRQKTFISSKKCFRILSNIPLTTISQWSLIKTSFLMIIIKVLALSPRFQLFFQLFKEIYLNKLLINKVAIKNLHLSKQHLLLLYLNNSLILLNRMIVE